MSARRTRERCKQADRAIASGGRVRHRTILLLEDETKCQVEFHDLCVHRSSASERGWGEVHQTHVNSVKT
ncbi:hypothetical protein [Nostoc sp.]|uniref:hypothetical protein n=1 Tax=Nostoc sp. TaxID=1180 RepID=UPI002FF99643